MKKASDNLLNADMEAACTAALVVLPLPAAGLVQIYDSDERHLEVRYYDVPEKYRVWLLPREDAQDLVRWWVEQGCTQTARGGFIPEQRFGRIFVSFLSQTQVYCRRSNPLGGPIVTEHQFPRAVVEALTVYLREVHNHCSKADTKTIGDTP